MKNHYFIEMTDTFSGEANYCWVNRFIVSASTPRGAMRRSLRVRPDLAYRMALITVRTSLVQAIDKGQFHG